MHRVSPITSPRADSKLKNWFRDRLVRRSSGPVPVYPHQPGPDFRSTSEIGFTGGAALTGSRAGSAAGETRGAALSSHPITGMDLDTSPPRDRDNGNGNGGTFLEMTKTTTGDSASDSGRHNGNSHSNGNGGNGNGNSKRNRLRKSFMKTLSRNSNSNSQEPKTNGSTNGGGHSRQNSTFSETKVSGTGDGLRGLRDSAHEQGLPAPPILGQTASTGRESRFSEDL